MGFVEASQKDWLGGRQFDVDRYLHGATLEETVATGVHCLVTGKGVPVVLTKDPTDMHLSCVDVETGIAR